jgi:hypothetical protein
LYVTRSWVSDGDGDDLAGVRSADAQALAEPKPASVSSVNSPDHCHYS